MKAPVHIIKFKEAFFINLYFPYSPTIMKKYFTYVEIQQLIKTNRLNN